MKTSEVINWLDEVFHPEYQEDYDNSGFLLGSGETNYTGALVALDLTPAVVSEAIEGGFSLVVTHHPFIFSGVKRLTDRTDTGRMALALAKAEVAVYAAHTNLDNLPWGVNGALAKVLGVDNCRVLRPFDAHSDLGAGMVGDLPTAIGCDAYLAEVKQRLGLPAIRTSAHDPNHRVRKVAFCGGSGASFIQDALQAGADLYLTADLKYHDFQRTIPRMVLADIGHYESEQFAKEIIFRAISEKFSNFACRISDVQHSIVSYI